jgi:aminobenzoyl-glutamate utilization protein B
MSIGHKGMMHAAKAMAVAAMRCYTDPSHIQKAREEFQQATQGRPYQTLIPDEIGKPRIPHSSPPGSLPERYPQFPFYKSINH